MKISYKYLFSNFCSGMGEHSLDCISSNDKPVLNSIERDYGYHGGYSINNDKALLALANHPLIFDAVTGEHIELTKTNPELIITEDTKNYQIKLCITS